MSRIVIEFSDPDALAKIDAAVARGPFKSREQFCVEATEYALSVLGAADEPEPAPKKKSKKSKERPSGLADGDQPEPVEPQEETAS